MSGSGKRGWRLLLALGAVVLGACQSSSPPPASSGLPGGPANPAEDTFRERQARLAAYRDAYADDPRALYRAATRVEAEDGIQEAEAWILAQAYLQAWVDENATIIEMKRTPTEWVAENMSAATEGPGPTIRVNRDNGSIRRQGSLQLVWPESFRDLL